jgi:hypothetical protein
LIRRIFGAALFAVGIALTILFFWGPISAHGGGGGEVGFLFLAGGSLVVGVKWMRGEVAGVPTSPNQFVLAKHQSPSSSTACSLCGKPIDLRSFKTDSLGNRCHWDCSASAGVPSTAIAVDASKTENRPSSEIAGKTISELRDNQPN